MNIHRLLSVILAGFLITVDTNFAAPATSFNYQGRLLDDGAPANGIYDLQFSLFSDVSGGSILTSPLVRDDISVSNGLFNVELDFGPNVFAGEKRWLAIGVRAGVNTGGFFTLPMRQVLASVPQSQFALVAGSVTGGAITAGMISNGAVTTDKIQDSAVTAAKIAAGQAVKSINGLKDNVSITAGANLTLTSDGNTLQFGVAPGSFVAPSQVMSILLENDGIGSGLSADFIDGIDSANLATKVEVQDRVLKDGDTMRGALTIQPFPGSQALLVRGDKTGPPGEAVAYVRNNRNANNTAPALRVENNAGTSADGALSVANTSADPDGYIARFGNSAKHVASLEVGGTLQLQPNSGKKALVLSGDTLIDPILEVRKSGFGDLAVFGNQTEDKLKIDYLGGIDSKGNLQADGSLIVGGNANIAGKLTALNMPFLQTTEHFRENISVPVMPRDQWTVVDELEITVPTPCDLYVSAHVGFGGAARAGEGFSTRVDMMFKLERMDGPNAPVLLGADGDDMEPDVYSNTRAAKFEATRVIRILEPTTIQLRTLALHGAADPTFDRPTGLGVLTSHLTAIYFPLPPP